MVPKVLEMSLYIVFRCTACGKVGISESRKSPKPTKRLTCRYCTKSFSFKNGQVMKVCQDPMIAKNLMNAHNLENCKDLSAKEKLNVFKHGYHFMENEAKKRH